MGRNRVLRGFHAVDRARHRIGAAALAAPKDWATKKGLTDPEIMETLRMVIIAGGAAMSLWLLADIMSASIDPVQASGPNPLVECLGRRI